MTISTPTELCNLSLDLLKEAEISDLDTDDGSAARWMNRNYEITRDYVLATFHWKFALVRVEIAKDVSVPTFGWNYNYKLPSDCIRILPLRINGELNGRLIPHEVEKGFILTNAEAPLKVRYISRVENVGEFNASPIFIEALTVKLAERAANWLTGKAGVADGLVARYNEAIELAHFVESSEGSEPSQYATEYDDIRHSWASEMGANWY